ncbi:hypothetical protein [Chryseobacterium wanjuense]
MELLNIKISRYTDLISAVKLFENNNILIVLLNPVDYVLDGICFINKKYVKHIDCEKDNELKVTIFAHKIKSFKINSIYKSLETIKDVTAYFLENNSKLIELGLDSSDYSIIGNVQKNSEKFFLVNMLSIKGKYLNEEKIEYDKVRLLTIESDYLNSLEYYMSI